jgi:oxygen-dependent protoporphyrinogen oxidase
MGRMHRPGVSSSPSLPLSPSATRRRIAVIGGGISGLAAAYRLTELDAAAEVVLFEASGRLGGVLETVRRDGWLIERSADMFTTREPWALDLCRRIGISDELIETDRRHRRAFVVHRGGLVPVPKGFTLMAPSEIGPMLTTPLFSPLGKLRLACECFIPPRRDMADESLESFAVRRFGREAFDRLIQPLISGIYTADPSKLSMAATLPQFVEMERKRRSLIRAMRGQRSGVMSQGPGARGQETRDGSAGGARYGLFVAPRNGMQQLVDAIANRLPPGCVRLNSAIERIERSRDAPWDILIQGRGTPEPFDDLILTTPGTVSSRLLRTVDEELASLIEHIPHASCSVALVGCRCDQIAHPLDGFGFVVPAVECRRIIACSMASVKFAGRAPDGKVLLRVFLGGALHPELGELPDDEIRKIVLQELSELIGLASEPEFCEVARWPGMMPQYHVGHVELVAKIEKRAAAIPHIALAGNAYRGVGIPFCIHSGEKAAEWIAASAECGARSAE